MNFDVDYMIKGLEKCLTYDPESPMIFNSSVFLFLFAGFMVIYCCLRNVTRMRLLFVTLFSYYFYYKSSGTYFFLLAIVTVSDFLLAKIIDETEKEWGRKLAVTMSLIVNLGLLGYFKYTNFFWEIWCNLTGDEFHAWDIFLPVGISFFTFQSLSYTIDVYRRQLEPLDNLLDYAFYVSFFPQLVAGPIVRAKDFIPQIYKPLLVTREMLGEGVFLIMGGLIKKAVISDYISVNYVERIFDNPSLYSGLENLLGMYGYTLQIYCDFSGYSDMAIGIALLLGFRFPQNFNAPFKSTSITEFWHRWHISLSTWLRDYLYISLGGNRKGQIRTYINLILTMLLGGLWHGASLNFVVWGGMHGVVLALERAKNKVLGRPKGWMPTSWRKWIGMVVTFHLVAIAFVFFRAQTFDGAVEMLARIVDIGDFHPELLSQLIMGYPGVFALMAMGFVMHFLPDAVYGKIQQGVTWCPLVVKAVMMAVVVYVVIQVKSSEIQPFIYFQF